MMFDFDAFTLRAKLAYRRCGGSLYSLNDALAVFRYYFDTYEMIMETAHPMISIAQIAGIIEKMPFILDTSAKTCDIMAEDYKLIIDQHFITEYKNCDYNINHFFSGKIRDLRYFEVLY